LQKEKRCKLENILSKIIAENFPNLRIRESSRYRRFLGLQTERIFPHHMIVKTLGIDNQKGILKAAKSSIKENPSV
jgi:hypothetical protein